jgi:hypothetical protein
MSIFAARHDDQRRKNGALREGGRTLRHAEIAWQLGKRFGSKLAPH